MHAHQDPAAWDALIRLTQRGKESAQGFRHVDRAAHMREFYALIHELLRRDEHKVELGYNWGVLNVNVRLKVEIDVWKEGDPGPDGNINTMTQQGGNADLRAQLRAIGFTDEEIDGFIDEDAPE